MTITVAASKREETGKRAKRLALPDALSAVVYGPKQEATPITVSLRTFQKVLKEAGESSVLELTGLGAPLQVLIHDVDHDPVTNIPRHADFYAIEKGAKVEVAVPLVFVGESPAVKGGASLVKVLHELEVEAAPADLPHELTVDISILANVGDQIHVGALSIPKGVEVKAEPDQVVALIQEVAVEEETAAPAPDMAAIEVEKKGKEEGGEEAEGEKGE
ncbi:50S ribosomal protein L25 [Candidatus Parcubacteria bacterium]|nr:50S ribosomal protein L25 [Candidatus Parcubacteria bacterium]